MACSSWRVERCVRRRMYFSVSVANQRSTWFNRDAEVGVKCPWNRGCLANQALIEGVLCMP